MIQQLVQASRCCSKDCCWICDNFRSNSVSFNLCTPCSSFSTNAPPKCFYFLPIVLQYIMLHICAYLTILDIIQYFDWSSSPFCLLFVVVLSSLNFAYRNRMNTTVLYFLTISLRHLFIFTVLFTFIEK